MRLFTFVAVICSLVLIGCNIETPVEKRTGITAPGNDVVINEVFHISPSQYYNYSWIELFNPTNQPINWFTERVLDDTTSLETRLVVRFRAQLKIYNFQGTTFNPSYILFTDTGEAYFTNYHTDVAIGGQGQGVVVQSQWYSSNDQVIFPGQYVVIVSDLDKFNQHTLSGPFNPTIFNMTLNFNSIQGTPSPAVILHIQNPVFPTDKNFYWFGSNVIWDLTDAGEVALLRYDDTVFTHTRTGPDGSPEMFTSISPGDSTFIDVARYGDYRPSPDLFPGNTPVGFVPAGHSLARYGSYYKTGNTQDEFYYSPDPIPGWYNQRQK